MQWFLHNYVIDNELLRKLSQVSKITVVKGEWNMVRLSHSCQRESDG